MEGVKIFLKLNCHVALCSFLLVLFSGPSVAQHLRYGLSIFPSSPNTASKSKLLISRIDTDCTGVTTNAVLVDWIHHKIDVSLTVQSANFGPCALPISGRPPLEVDFGVPPFAGNFEISIFEDDQLSQHGVLFHPDNLVETLQLSTSEPNTSAFPETPAEGSIQSGIGIVRGWACEAWLVEVQFDDGPRRKVAYGTERTDTNTICGDDDNGYGMIIAWGLLGHGSHTMKTFINNVEISEAEFLVNGLDDPFIKGLSAEYELDGFPAPGKTAVVRWSEADQNFIIIDTQ